MTSRAWRPFSLIVPPEILTDAADNAIRHGRKNCLAVQGDPALASVTYNFRRNNQLAHQDCFVSLET
jgi:hypothetical protein